MVKKNVLAISGSTRKQSVNKTLLKAIADLYADDINLTIYEAIGELPPFNPDLDTAEVAPAVGRFRELIEKAAGVLICTPEYVFSLPGALKNALEWTVSSVVFTEKPVALLTASTSGEKAHESLILIMKTLGAHVEDNTNLLISAPKQKISQDGDIIDQTTLQDVKRLMNYFLEHLS